MADPRVKALKIKTGVVKRLTKEKTVYEKEADAQRVRIQKLKDQGKDEYTLRKEEEVLQECLMMVPDCQKRLLKAYNELKTIVDDEADLKDMQEYTAAHQVLEEAVAQLPNPGEPLHAG